MSDPQATDQAASNSLGLDLAALKIKDSAVSADPSAQASSPVEGPTKSADEQTEVAPDDDRAQDNSAEGKKEPKEKKKPYVNPDRVKTGGAQRDKLSEEELAERMARIREQNEKIKQRRLDVQADEDEYKKTQAAERAKLAKMKKVQENVDKAREQNARRKMDKVQSREWDSGKPARDWKQPKKPGDETAEDADKKPPQSIGIRGAVRGGGRGGGRGRGRGGGGANAASVAEKKETVATPASEASTPAGTAAASS
ncbi:hypothetical protein C8Q79DRAFT_956247 [Trametes meyenii]|nr:hypothetical protein C8Q79DRAFT_956247 [Trametes meyenii]